MNTLTISNHLSWYLSLDLFGSPTTDDDDLFSSKPVAKEPPPAVAKKPASKPPPRDSDDDLFGSPKADPPPLVAKKPVKQPQQDAEGPSVKPSSVSKLQVREWYREVSV